MPLSSPPRWRLAPANASPDLSNGSSDVKFRRGDFSRLIGTYEQAATPGFGSTDDRIIEEEAVRGDVQEGRRVHLLERGLGRLLRRPHLCIRKDGLQGLRFFRRAGQR